MWEVTETAEFKKWFEKLSHEKLLATTKLVFFLKQLGLRIGMPYSRALGKGLFELRDQQFGLRIYYTFAGKEIILLVQGGSKTSQERDIEKARALIKKYQEGSCQ